MQHDRYTAETALAWGCLISGILISIAAMSFSVVGLMAMFSASPVMIMFMGIFIESGKNVLILTMKKFWGLMPIFLKIPTTVVAIILMSVTSMGVYGYLTKAHLENAAPMADISAKVAEADAQLAQLSKTVEYNRRALEQMDNAIDQLLQRTTDAAGANSAVFVRSRQAKERNRLNAEIESASAKISEITDEIAPLRGQLRGAEAEVGPIKYVAAMMYGDDVDSATLERAVRWMILLIVIVFDPLAVMLLLSSQIIFEDVKNKKKADAALITHDFPIDDVQGDDVVLSEIDESVSDILSHIPARHFHMSVNETVTLGDSIGSPSPSSGHDVFIQKRLENDNN